MKDPVRNTLVAMLTQGALLVCITLTAAAEPPSGAFEYDFPGAAGVRLWNLSGVHALPLGAAQVRQKANGTVSASYLALDPSGTNVMLTGTLKSAKTDLSFRLRSIVAVDDFNYLLTLPWDYQVQRKDTFNLVFDSSDGVLSGSDRVSRTIIHQYLYFPVLPWESKGTKMKTERKTKVSYEEVSFSTPSTADGTWQLSMSIMPTGNKLTGSASVVFADGETYHFRLQGSYLPKNGKTKLVLVGDGKDKGARLQLTLTGPEMGIESLAGTVAGQRLRFPQS
jgi:hypothetical protein